MSLKIDKLLALSLQASYLLLPFAFVYSGGTYEIV